MLFFFFLIVISELIHRIRISVFNGFGLKRNNKAKSTILLIINVNYERWFIRSGKSIYKHLIGVVIPANSLKYEKKYDKNTLSQICRPNQNEYGVGQLKNTPNVVDWSTFR